MTQPLVTMTQPFVIKYIVAGTSQEYEAWLRRRGLDRRAYRYVTNPGMLRGMTNIQGFFIGTYLNRLDIEEIREQIAVSKLRGPSRAAVFDEFSMNGWTDVVNQPYTVE